MMMTDVGLALLLLLLVPIGLFDGIRLGRFYFQADRGARAKHCSFWSNIDAAAMNCCLFCGSPRLFFLPPPGRGYRAEVAFEFGFNDYVFMDEQHHGVVPLIHLFGYVNK